MGKVAKKREKKGQGEGMGKVEKKRERKGGGKEEGRKKRQKTKEHLPGYLASQMG
jgi:hypothetical protein